MFYTVTFSLPHHTKLPFPMGRSQINNNFRGEIIFGHVIIRPLFYLVFRLNVLKRFNFYLAYRYVVPLMMFLNSRLSVYAR